MKSLRSIIDGAIGRLLNSTTKNPAQWFIDWIHGGTESDSGVTINNKTVLQYAPVWNAVNKIAGHVGQLPLPCYQRIGERSKRKARTHPGYYVINQRPNELMTPILFRETMQQHALLWGNGRAGIVRNNRNDPMELIILLPDRTKTVLVNEEKWHVYTPKAGEPIKIKDEDVLHIAGLSFDGLVGYSLIEVARNSLGLGLAGEKHASRHYKNNAIPGLVLEAPAGAFRSEEEATDLLKNWHRYHSGIDQTSRTGLLREGIKANTLGMSGRDAQFIEQRRFQRQEAALWFLLESILGDDSSVSYNSLEQKNLAYLANCLMRWLVKWEQECNSKLLRETEFARDSHYFKFITAALLRASTKDRYETYEKGIAARILSPNEARALEELDPYDGGDEYENPNITPGSPGSTAENARKLSVAKLRQTIQRERAAVVAAADKAANFIGWLDSFYSRFELTIGEAVIMEGGDYSAAEEHCRRSKESLLDAAGECTPANLREHVERLTADWAERAEQLAPTTEIAV